jgi:glycogen(starch) synthase
MFGWEFPPHISGGLGTACFGLTKSLSHQDVKVRFVVPRFVGGESQNDPELVDASAARSYMMKSANPNTTRKTLSRHRTRRTQHVTARGNITFIEVPANLSPYHTSPAHLVRTENLSQWNYSMTASKKHAETVEEIGAMNQHQPYQERKNASSESDLYGGNLMREVRKYARAASAIAQEYDFDVIHAHDWMTFLAGINAKRESKKPLVVHVHSTEFDRAGEHANKDVIEHERLGLNEADKIITVSNWTKNIVMDRYGIPANKIEVIYNGVLPKEAPEEFPFPEIGSHIVTFLGRVTHQKGPGYFVEAAHKVLQEFPEAHFIVAGAGDLLPQTIERVATLNMSANFHFTGFLKGDQVDQVWSLTDVYVMPSVSEPFGIAPLEAIQGGVPVILSNQSGVSEVMPHAIKVDFWDTKAVAAAICSVLRYESLSSLLRQNSKQHIKHLTWDKAASGVKALYHELIREQEK